MPDESGAFELLLGEKENEFSLKAPDGRFLVAEGRDARQLRADSPRNEPGDRETFVLEPFDGRRVSLRARGYRAFLIVDPTNDNPAEPPVPANPADENEDADATEEGVTEKDASEEAVAEEVAEQPEPSSETDNSQANDFDVDDSEADDSTPSAVEPRRPAELVEIFQLKAMPLMVRITLPRVVKALVVEELTSEEFNEKRSKLKEKFINLPAPTLRQPKRMKRHKVFAMREEQHIKARLADTPEINIPQMPYLIAWPNRERGILMFSAGARLPIRGWVRYTVPEAWSVSTNFRTVIHLSLAGEVQVEKRDDQLKLHPPQVVDLRVELRKLDISNDLINIAREAIEDGINDELRRQRGRIHQQANKQLAKAFDTQEFRHPLLRYLRLP